MWQVVLGLRSLLVKIAVFVVMAALLAWALGGTLWPRTSIRTIGTPVVCNGVPVVLVHQVREPRATYGIARIGAGGEIEGRTPKVEEMTPAWRDAMTAVASPDGASAAFAFEVAGKWSIGVVESPMELGSGVGWRDWPVLDRLEAARQLARFAEGLPLQDEATQRAARSAVLDAGE
ncbi:MAG: hypothetical protein ACO3NL_09065 [Phycisphaerales bacterium]